MLIDVSYFVSGPRHIQNASMSKTAGADSLAVRGHIEAYIKEVAACFPRSHAWGKRSRLCNGLP